MLILQLYCIPQKKKQQLEVQISRLDERVAQLNEQAVQIRTLLAQAKEESDSLRIHLTEFDVSALHAQQACSTTDCTYLVVQYRKAL